MKTRKYSRVGYKCCDGNYYEDTYGRRITPVEVRELPLEELNSYQKRLIGALCRRFAAEGAERVTEELDKLQYCSPETALRVAQNGGYLPQETKEEATMPKAIMTEEQIIEMIGLYNGGMKPAKLAERYGLDSRQVRNLLNKAKINDKYKHLFTTIQAPVPSENDIDRAANAIDNYLTEKELTGDITGADLTQKKPQTLTATGEGLIEAADKTVYVDGQNVMEKIADKLQEDFIGFFYGRITVHFEVLPDRDPLIFEIGG